MGQRWENTQAGLAQAGAPWVEGHGVLDVAEAQGGVRRAGCDGPSLAALQTKSPGPGQVM